MRFVLQVFYNAKLNLNVVVKSECANLAKFTRKLSFISSNISLFLICLFSSHSDNDFLSPWRIFVLWIDKWQLIYMVMTQPKHYKSSLSTMLLAFGIWHIVFLQIEPVCISFLVTLKQKDNNDNNNNNNNSNNASNHNYYYYYNHYYNHNYCQHLVIINYSSNK